MLLSSKNNTCFALAVCAISLLCATGAHAVMDPRFELDPQTLSNQKQPEKSRKAAVRRSSHSHVKAGRKNRHPLVGSKAFQTARSGNAKYSGSDPVPEQVFRLESPVAALSEHEVAERLLDVWNRIVPSDSEQQKPLAIRTDAFSLTLDPVRYPVFARMDGGRIILDQDGTIPPLVKSLIEDKDASVRIISEGSSETNLIMSSLLGAAGFYSVESNFNMEFGVDPKLTIQADFKVEKTSESIIKQDVVLLNSGRTSLPHVLGEFLKKEGFLLYEPFVSLKPSVQRDTRTINYISAKNQPEMIDSILAALSVSAERDRTVDVFAADNNGISLSVKAERYFDRGGQHFVVSVFNGDPINYTLFRILETKGYNVTILDA